MVFISPADFVSRAIVIGHGRMYVCMCVCIMFFPIFSSTVRAILLKFGMYHNCLCRVTQAYSLIDYYEINRLSAKNRFPQKCSKILL